MKATGKLSTGVAQVRKTRPFASISTTLSGCKGFASVGGSRVSRTTATWPHGWPSTSTTSFMPATSPSAQSKISTGALPSAGKASKHKLKAATGAFLADILLFARPSVTGRSYAYPSVRSPSDPGHHRNPIPDCGPCTVKTEVDLAEVGCGEGCLRLTCNRGAVVEDHAAAGEISRAIRLPLAISATRRSYAAWRFSQDRASPPK